MGWRKEYTIINHSIGEITDIHDLLTNSRSSLYNSKITIGELLAYTADGIQNIERYYSTYGNDTIDLNWNEIENNIKLDIQKYLDGYDGEPHYNELRLGTPLAIPLDALNNNQKLTNVVKSDYYEYSPLDIDYISSSMEDISAYELVTEMVLVWSRGFQLALGRESETPYCGALVNLTQYVTSLQHSKGADISESLSLMLNDAENVLGGDLYYLVSDSWKYDGGGYKYADSSFAKYLRRGDIIFCKRRPSREDIDQVNLRTSKGFVDKTIFNDIKFDVITRITDININSQISNRQITVTSSGIASILDDDGSSFLNQLYFSDKINAESSLGINISSGIMRYHGRYNSIFQKLGNDIRTQLMFVMDYMSSYVGFTDLPDYILKSRKMKLNIPDAKKEKLSGLLRLIDIEMDNSLVERKILNGSIGNMYGSLWSQMANYIPKTLSEVITKVRDNMIIMNVRRPPFDKKGVDLYIDSGSLIRIKPEQVVDMSGLSFDKRVFSWYRIDYNFFKSLEDANLNWLIPAKLFELYFKLWGDKPMAVQSPFVDRIIKTKSSDDDILIKDIVRLSLIDLRYVIESHAYLPFSRQGVISLSLYDKRIKAGTWVLNEATGEIFYVNKVNSGTAMSQDSISNYMNVGVERGMLLSQLDKYFDIIDMPIESSKPNVNNEIAFTDIIASWKVKENNFKQLLYMRNGDGWSDVSNRGAQYIADV